MCWHKALYESSLAFGLRKVLQAEDGKEVLAARATAAEAQAAELRDQARAAFSEPIVLQPALACYTCLPHCVHAACHQGTPPWHACFAPLRVGRATSPHGMTHLLYSLRWQMCISRRSQLTLMQPCL